MLRLTRRTVIVLVLCAVVVATGAIVWLRLKPVATTDVAVVPTAEPTELRAADTVIAKRRTLERTTTLNSELRPFDQVNLYAKAAGYVRDIYVDYGSRVDAGQTIATLELPEQEQELERAQAAYNLAKIDDARVALVSREEPGAIAAVDVDKARADYQMAQDELKQAQVVLSYGVITAPFRGVITKRYVDPGALIAQGTTSTNASPIVQISNNYLLRMVVETPESIVAKIAVGTPVVVRIQSTDQTISGHVARFAYELHQDTRTMHTEVDVPNDDLVIKPGMFASVELVLADRRNVVTVPTQAVSTEGSPNVWVVDANDVIREHAVTLGLQTPDYVEITSGVRPGERIFFGNRDSFTVGTHVSPHAVVATTKF